MKQICRSPVRRRSHACALLGKYMIVHGGIEVRKTRSQPLIYDIEKNQWSSPFVRDFPALSHHKLVNPFLNKKLRKNKQFEECLYMFGGLNEKGIAKNQMYKIKILNETELSCEKIQTKNPPLPRHSFILESLDLNTLVLYGGKHHDEIDNEFTIKGIYSDLHLFSIDTSTWTIPVLPFKLSNRFGMCSTSDRNKVYIFGGSLL